MQCLIRLTNHIKTLNMKNVLRWFTNLFTPIIYTKWKVSKTIWPYEPGYGIVRRNRITGSGTILDTGTTRMYAEIEVRILNEHPTITSISFDEIINKRIHQYKKNGYLLGTNLEFYLSRALELDNFEKMTNISHMTHMQFRELYGDPHYNHVNKDTRIRWYLWFVYYQKAEYIICSSKKRTIFFIYDKHKIHPPHAKDFVTELDSLQAVMKKHYELYEDPRGKIPVISAN